MKKHELEYKTLEIVNRVRNRQPIEDSSVELKAIWPTEPAKAARRLAAHANSMRGEPILWIIGLDEEKGVIGADDTELSTWLRSVSACFDSLLSPELLLNLAVPVAEAGKTVVALYFETDRMPFVVKNPAFGKHDGGAVEYEVPWREGNSTRTARRADLLRLLVPIQRIPASEILDAKMECTVGQQLDWKFVASLYVLPRDQTPIYLPHHKSKGCFDDLYSGKSIWFNKFNVLFGSTKTIKLDESQVTFVGPGKCSIQGTALTPFRSSGYPDKVNVHLSLGIANSDGATIDIEIPLTQDRAKGKTLSWVYVSSN